MVFFFHATFNMKIMYISSLLIQYVQDEVADRSLGEEHKYEITESMRREMEYDADRAWYLNLVLKLFFFDIFLNHCPGYVQCKIRLLNNMLEQYAGSFVVIVFFNFVSES